MTFAGEGSRAQSNGLRRSVTLDALQAIYAIGTGPGGVSLARLPHGECGAWGRAPRWSNFRITHGTALIFRDQQTIKNRDRAHRPAAVTETPGKLSFNVVDQRCATCGASLGALGWTANMSLSCRSNCSKCCAANSKPSTWSPRNEPRISSLSASKIP